MQIFRPVEIELEQGSDKWHKWRSQGLGASDAAVIMGLTKYDDLISFWEYKTGLVDRIFVLNDAILNGQILEPKARVEFEKHTGETVFPKCFEHPTDTFIRASLDGITDDLKLILEVKCPSQFFTHYRNRSKIQLYYYSQMQQQLYVTGAEVVCFWSYTLSGGYMQEVYPDMEFIEELVRRARKFWNLVERKIKPKPNDFLKYLSNSMEYPVVKPDTNSMYQQLIETGKST